jgi:hypothetical protein
VFIIKRHENEHHINRIINDISAVWLTCIHMTICAVLWTVTSQISKHCSECHYCSWYKFSRGDWQFNLFVFMDWDNVLCCVCVCDCNDPRSMYLWYRVVPFPWILLIVQYSSGNSSIHPMQTLNQGPWQDELCANCNVKTKTVLAEPLVIEDLSARGWAGCLQQIRYAIASSWSCYVSQWSWESSTC